jgi:hypothetical protein
LLEAGEESVKEGHDRAAPPGMARCLESEDDLRQASLVEMRSVKRMKNRLSMEFLTPTIRRQKLINLLLSHRYRRRYCCGRIPSNNLLHEGFR